jgi:D-alanyl-D-alanine carboxypeptidase
VSGFDAAISRVKAIHQQAERVLAQAASEPFDAVLARQTGQTGNVAGAAKPLGSFTTGYPILDTNDRITLGQMLTPVAPTFAASAQPAPVPVTGIYTADQLDAYVRSHAVEGRNGRLEPHELVATPGGWHGDVELLPPAAEAWRLMRAAAAADGIELRAIDSYRDWDTQHRAHQEFLAGEKPANVLPPGTSEHGNGLAVDVTNGAIIGSDDREWVWLNQHGRDFGWYPISNETWHWEFRGTGA